MTHLSKYHDDPCTNSQFPDRQSIQSNCPKTKTEKPTLNFKSGYMHLPNADGPKHLRFGRFLLSKISALDDDRRNWILPPKAPCVQNILRENACVH